MQHKNYCKYSATALEMVCCCLMCVLVCVLLSSCSSETSRVNDVALSVNSENFRYSNVRQNHTDIMMQTIDEKLYLYLPHLVNGEPSIYVFDQNGASKLENILISRRYRPLWNDVIAGFGNGYLYIKRFPGKDNESAYPEMAELMYYDLITGASGTLLNTEKPAYMDTMFDENGYLYVSTAEISPSKEKQYYIFQENILLPDMSSQPDIRTGTVSEVLRNYNCIMPMLSENQLKNAIVSVIELGIDGYGCVLYPVREGWLLHISRGCIPLCLVSSDGSVTSLFEYSCLDSVSSFNYYGDYAFLSFVRYEKWDAMDFGMLPYENDTISGTYRIDLTNLAVTKISDNDYRGIFIFDNTCMFVCDKNEGVYQLDFNGDLMSTLINPRN